MSLNTNSPGIPGGEIKALEEIYEVGKYEDIYKGELIECKDWTDEQVLDFLNTIPKEHDLYLPVGFIENIEKDPFQLYCDTDSVGEDSIIRIKNLYEDNIFLDEGYTEISVKQFWDSLNSIDAGLNNGKEFKDVSELDIFTPTILDKEFKVKDCRIKKIIRHEVSKQLWNLRVDFSNDVDVTEDHSLVIKDDNNSLIIVTILELLNPESLIHKKYVNKISELYDRGRITYGIDLKNSSMVLGLDLDNTFTLFEERYICLTKIPTKTKYVYDLEVEDNPVFFANNILVHNSDYLLITLTFDKNKDNVKTVDYCQKLTIRMNEAYMAALDLYFYKIANWHPDFNTMDFKSEVVAYKGFFGAKKFYALGKIWDEGKFMSELSIKKTGGQLKKADATKVTKEMLEDVYNLLTKDQTITNKVTMYNKIFIEIKNKYVFKLKQAIQDMDFEYFTIPKKWSFGDKKNIPPQIIGAKLYNRIIKDTFTIGDAVLVLSIKFNLPLMKKEFEKLNNPNENMLQNNELTSKIGVISLPPVSRLKEEDKTLIKQKFRELDIRLDYDTIMNFNIDMKLEPFKALFDLETTRKANALSGH